MTDAESPAPIPHWLPVFCVLVIISAVVAAYFLPTMLSAGANRVDTYWVGFAVGTAIAWLTMGFMGPVQRYREERWDNA